MMAGAAYVVDTSVIVLRGRDESVRHRFNTLLIEGRIVLCQMVLLECLNNAPDPKSYERMWADLQGQRWQDVNTEVMDRALDVHRMLAKKSQHRGFRLPDLIIAATAELAGLTVLHYDEDYDRIAKVTGQAVEWVVPKGSL
ncbi:PIN domain nuclease [Kribbella solani]|uniref:PIN domain nuclease n=1 Tax=Kribbella solani TaxID=236067 RepID=UPI0029BE3647|nr:PIN domain nuclease [Kribbella solani]MDX2972023.1 PIN domain nuclease [Kribbella solani]MDX3000364.1 PIN domain nuclease [Kribbella solani]